MVSTRYSDLLEVIRDEKIGSVFFKHALRANSVC